MKVGHGGLQRAYAKGQCVSKQANYKHSYPGRYAGYKQANGFFCEI